MTVCKIVGRIVSTVKDSRLQGYKLLLCQEMNTELKTKGALFVAVDCIGAGEGDTVLVVKGSAAQVAVLAPIDAAIIAIVDTIEKDWEGRGK